MHNVGYYCIILLIGKYTDLIWFDLIKVKFYLVSSCWRIQTRVDDMVGLNYTKLMASETTNPWRMSSISTSEEAVG